MRHPITPCPAHLKPTFAQVLSRAKKLHANCPSAYFFICLELEKIEGENSEAEKFISDCLGNECITLNTWLMNNNPELYRSIIKESDSDMCKTVEPMDAMRIEWLEFLVGTGP